MEREIERERDYKYSDTPKKTDSKFRPVFFVCLLQGLWPKRSDNGLNLNDLSEASVHVGALEEPREVATGAEYGTKWYNASPLW